MAVVAHIFQRHFLKNQNKLGNEQNIRSCVNIIKRELLRNLQ
jgi:hypothetical protein